MLFVLKLVIWVLNLLYVYIKWEIMYIVCVENDLQLFTVYQLLQLEYKKKRKKSKFEKIPLQNVVCYKMLHRIAPAISFLKK